MIDLRHGDYRTVLADVRCDAVICDPPFSERNHAGHNSRVPDGRRALSYAHWTPDDVRAFVAFWSERTAGWIVAMTSHDLAPAYEEAFRAAGRYPFAPLPWIAHGSRVRFAGDGPSCWTMWIMVARPRTKAMARWGALPGAYLHSAQNNGSFAHNAQDRRIGGKPLGLMRALVRDYSRPGDLVCDPVAGYGTTLVAARAEGRRAVGAEIDADTFTHALRHQARACQPTLAVEPRP